MQPKPSADTSRLCFPEPRVRCFIFEELLLVAFTDVSFAEALLKLDVAKSDAPIAVPVFRKFLLSRFCILQKFIEQSYCCDRRKNNENETMIYENQIKNIIVIGLLAEKTPGTNLMFAITI